MENIIYLMPMVTASISELFSLIIFLPFDLIRTRMQISTIDYKYKSVVDGLN